MSKTKFASFLQKHYIKKDQQFTHTRIKSEQDKVTGGSYYIPYGKELTDFYKIYYEHVFVKRQKEYITERQNIGDDSPILCDLDFRYTTDVTCRLHNENFIEDLRDLYLEKLHEIFIFRENTSFPVFVFEKPNVKIMEDKTKDGIHMIIGIQCNREIQKLLRKQVIDSFNDISNDLPFTNSVEDIFDISITSGKTNWQLYGSQKPGSEAYKLTYIYNVKLNEDTDMEISRESIDDFISEFDNFKLLSAQYKEHSHYDIQPSMIEYINSIKSNNNNRTKNSQELAPPLYQLTQYGMGYENYLSNIKSISDIQKITDKLFHQNSIRGDDYKIKETHEMTMILPESYYIPYDKWIRVGWALKNTDFRLFFTWILFSSQSPSFDINDIQQRYIEWCNFKEGPECLSYKSISLWAKSYYDQLCRDDRTQQNKYKIIVENTVEYYLTESIASGGADFDLAMVMYQRYKDDFKCAQAQKNIWYQFENHRWLEIEGSVVLKRLYSTNLYKLYNTKTIEILNKMNALDKTDNEYDNYEKLLANVSKICQKLKDSNKKTGLYNAAKELFYDREFVHLIDKNPDLMVFKNGVIDFKSKEFRSGYAEDYLTMTTGIEYKPMSYYREHKSDLISDINSFLETLFPIHEVNRYMRQFLASTLIGTNLNHKFRIFLGSGSNGKSILIKLMSKILGPYQGILPGQVITQKRIGVGNASPEIMSLMGTRLAVIQEPSKGEKLNDGPMKELTGGDPITGRKLYHDQVTFDPQFDLAVCANNLYDIDDTSEGTWRRIDLIPFVSKFVDDVNDPQHSNHEYVFPKDKFLDKKFDIWKEVFISMLVEIAFETNGIVESCETIRNYSYEYETNQNTVLKFIRTCVKESEGNNVKISGLWRDYQLWMQLQGNQKLQKRGDLQEKMNKLYGDYKKHKCWKNIKVVINEENDDDDDDDEQEQSL